MTWRIWQILTWALKNLKICTLMDCFDQSIQCLSQKKYRGFMFDGTEYWCKMWRKNDLRLQKWHTMTYFSWKTKHHIFLLLFSFFFFFFTVHFLKNYQSILYFPMVSPYESFRQITVAFSASRLCYLCNIFSINFTATTFCGSSFEKFVLKNNNRFWS